MKKILVIMLALILAGTGCTNIAKEKEIEETVPKDTVIIESPVNPVGPVKQDIEVGKESPDFTLKNLAGEEVSLSDYRGKIVLINFWATWCKYCDMEMPDLQRIHEENDDLVILAVNQIEDKETVKKYIEKSKYDFEVILDSNGDISRTYLVRGLPTSYFVDAEGILLGGVPQMLTYDQFNEILADIRGEE